MHDVTIAMPQVVPTSARGTDRILNKLRAETLQTRLNVEVHHQARALLGVLPEEEHERQALPPLLQRQRKRRPAASVAEEVGVWHLTCLSLSPEGSLLQRFGQLATRLTHRIAEEAPLLGPRPAAEPLEAGDEEQGLLLCPTTPLPTALGSGALPRQPSIMRARSSLAGPQGSVRSVPSADSEPVGRQRGRRGGGLETGNLPPPYTTNPGSLAVELTAMGPGVGSAAAPHQQALESREVTGDNGGPPVDLPDEAWWMGPDGMPPQLDLPSAPNAAAVPMCDPRGGDVAVGGGPKLVVEHCVMWQPSDLARLPEMDLGEGLSRRLHCYAHGGFMGAAISMLADPEYENIFLDSVAESSTDANKLALKVGKAFETPLPL